MREVLLNTGEVALVDDEDYPAVSVLQWGKARMSPGYWYALSTSTPRVWMHHYILGTNPSREVLVDHRNHNTLDNRRHNLRKTTQSQNQQNRKGARKDSGTGVRGVSWHKASRKYMAYTVVNRKYHHLGYYPTLEEAEAAAIAGRLRLHTHSDGR